MHYPWMAVQAVMRPNPQLAAHVRFLLVFPIWGEETSSPYPPDVQLASLALAPEPASGEEPSNPRRSLHHLFCEG